MCGRAAYRTERVYGGLPVWVCVECAGVSEVTFLRCVRDVPAEDARAHAHVGSLKDLGRKISAAVPMLTPQTARLLGELHACKHSKNTPRTPSLTTTHGHPERYRHVRVCMQRRMYMHVYTRACTLDMSTQVQTQLVPVVDIHLHLQVPTETRLPSGTHWQAATR